MINVAKPTPNALNEFMDSFKNEAWDAYRTTGLTPRQLLEQRDELVEVLSAIKRLILNDEGQKE